MVSFAFVRFMRMADAVVSLKLWLCDSSLVSWHIFLEEVACDCNERSVIIERNESQNQNKRRQENLKSDTVYL